MDKIYKYKYQLILFLIVILLFWLNYIPGTYLTGWDNLQTELNPGLAVKRALFSVWEEYQSFGLTAGMAHATDLVRASFLWLISFVLPQNVVRYFYQFLMLLLGSLGMFVLLKASNFKKPVSLLGALFYMLNIGTVQMFYLPFEAFSSFFGFLPWAIWTLLRLLRRSVSRNDILIFFLINLLGTPAFYTQALFAVYLLVLACIGFGKFISTRINNDSGHVPIKLGLARMTFIFTLIFLINSFWILPQIYFLKTNGSWITQSKANQLATERTYYQNLDKGTINNFLRLEGFYFDAKAANGLPLFMPWQAHFSGWAMILPNFFTFLMVIGVYETLRKKKFGYILVLIICSLALLSATPPFSWIDSLIRKNILLNQIFRSPFTKFIIPYSLIYSYFVTQAIDKILKTRTRNIFNLLWVSIFLLIAFYSFPSFRGFLISPEMKVKIPNDYLKLISYFKKTDKNKRIALLPDYTFWGWFFHRWGYNGSGFLWYGIEQPIISRTFDVWNPASESYFWEQKQIIESEDLAKLETIYEKYNIDYVLIDYSLIPIISSYKSLQYDRIDNLFRQSKKITPVFKGENITLYKFRNDLMVKNFVSVSSDLSNIGPGIKVTNDDSAYLERGIYQTNLKNPFVLYYPFLNLTSQTRIYDKMWQIEEDEGSISVISKNVPVQPSQNLIISPSYPAVVLKNDEVEKINLDLVAKITDGELKIIFDKKMLESPDVANLDYSNEFGFNFPNLSQKYGYLIKIRSRNYKGLPLSFYIVDETKKQTVIEGNLRDDFEYFILPAKFMYGVGYRIVFTKPAYQVIKSRNLLEEISIYLFPYQALKSIKLVDSTININSPKFLSDFEVEKANYYIYKIRINQQLTTGSDLILFQSFDPGWIAVNDGKILEHVLVNNWANGWALRQGSAPQGTEVVVIFWPQYLEYLGFVLLIGSFLWILTRKSD